MIDHNEQQRREWIVREKALERVYADDYLHQQWERAIYTLRKKTRIGWLMDRLLHVHRRAA